MTFRISKDDITPELGRRIRRLDGPQRTRFMLRWGAATRLEAQRNATAKGGRRFWRQVARSVRVVSAGPTSVSVNAYHVAAAQKQFGGKISAPGRGEGSKQADALAVPFPGSRAEGRTPSEFGDLDMIPRQGKPPLLIAKRGRAVKGTRFTEVTHYELLFVLVKSVDQRKDPWWPKTSDVMRRGERLAMEMVMS